MHRRASMSRNYTNLTQWVILNIYHEQKHTPGGGDYMATCIIKKDKSNGEIYEFEDNMKPRKLNNYKSNQSDNRTYDVVVQYIENESFVVDIRDYRTKYEIWYLDIKKQEWDHQDITEDVVMKGKDVMSQQLIQQSLEREKIEQEMLEQIEKQQKTKQQMEKFKELMTHLPPEIKEYIDLLKKEKKDSEHKAHFSDMQLQQSNDRFKFQMNRNKELENEITDLKKQTKPLQDEITRLKRKILPSWINNSGPKEISDLISQLKFLNET
jgi:hypothetical protein